MGSRNPRIVRCPCGHDGCKEFARYEAHTRADENRIWINYGNGKWRCARHSSPDKVLSIDNLRRSTNLTNQEKSTGLYWDGITGFSSGPGFKAFARDFPPGTMLRVTAEILLPEEVGAQPKAEPVPNPSNPEGEER